MAKGEESILELLSKATRGAKNNSSLHTGRGLRWVGVGWGTGPTHSTLRIPACNPGKDPGFGASRSSFLETNLVCSLCEVVSIPKAR